MISKPESAGGVAEVRIRGKNRIVPSATIGNQIVVVASRWPRVASLQDEEFVQPEALGDPSAFVSAVKRSGLAADLFTFVQVFPDVEPKHPFHLEWDNVAALETRSYEDWLNRQINGNQRKILRRSLRRGVSVEETAFNDEFVRGIVEIYNETPVRQGRPFWHFGKDFATVKREAATYPDRSLFLGAYLEGSLIGFMKIVFVGRVARMMHILSMAAHADKLPTNALIAKAVEVCCERRCTHLTYGRFSYGNISHSSLAEFKLRNGFRKFAVPRYFVPMTLQGRLAMKAGLHMGFKSLLPEPAMKVLLGARAQYSRLLRARGRGGRVHEGTDGAADDSVAREEHAARNVEASE